MEKEKPNFVIIERLQIRFLRETNVRLITT
jgi:hypothetical protein